MKIHRSTEFDVTSAQDFMIGDQIDVGKYTATCQKVINNGALFLLDQYLDDAYLMNEKETNEGGYEVSDLRKAINKEEVLDIFSDIRDIMIPLENGDLVRIPYAEEMFGEVSYHEPSGKKQWDLMKIRRNRVADRGSEIYEWGWLQNRLKSSKTFFFFVSHYGNLAYGSASNPNGVRLVFCLG